jgi:hypothetical protein
MLIRQPLGNLGKTAQLLLATSYRGDPYKPQVISLHEWAG